MNKFMVIPEGFAGFPEAAAFITPAENRKNYATAVRDWHYGPAAPTIEPGENKKFYTELADAMQCTEKDARRKHCSNCDFYANGVMSQVRIEKIPFASHDTCAGFRGHCEKLDFICNDMRVCQAWKEQLCLTSE